MKQDNKDTVLINILVRYHSGRKLLFERAYNSLREQTYTHWNLNISYETEQDLAELTEILGGEIMYANLIQVTPQREAGEFFYNLYLNDLKKEIVTGWALIYDSDNYFYLPTSLEKLSKELINPYEIHIIQFVRRGKCRPSDNQIYIRELKSGHSDSASIVFHESHKNKSHFDATENADYKFILQLLNQYPSKWHKIRVVETDRRSHGA